MVCENSWGLLTTDFRSSKKIRSFSKKDFTFFWKANYFLDVIYLIRSNLKATLIMFSSTRIKIYPLVHLSPISPTLTVRSATVFLCWVKARSPKSCLCFHSYISKIYFPYSIKNDLRKTWQFLTEKLQCLCMCSRVTANPWPHLSVPKSSSRCWLKVLLSSLARCVWDTSFLLHQQPGQLLLRVYCSQCLGLPDPDLFKSGSSLSFKSQLKYYLIR